MGASACAHLGLGPPFSCSCQKDTNPSEIYPSSPPLLHRAMIFPGRFSQFAQLAADNYATHCPRFPPPRQQACSSNHKNRDLLPFNLNPRRIVFPIWSTLLHICGRINLQETWNCIKPKLRWPVALVDHGIGCGSHADSAADHQNFAAGR